MENAVGIVYLVMREMDDGQSQVESVWTNEEAAKDELFDLVQANSHTYYEIVEFYVNDPNGKVWS